MIVNVIRHQTKKYYDAKIYSNWIDFQFIIRRLGFLPTPNAQIFNKKLMNFNKISSHFNGCIQIWSMLDGLERVGAGIALPPSPLFLQIHARVLLEFSGREMK